MEQTERISRVLAASGGGDQALLHQNMEYLHEFREALRCLMDLARRPDPFIGGSFEALLVELDVKLSRLIERTEGFKEKYSHTR